MGAREAFARKPVARPRSFGLALLLAAVIAPCFAASATAATRIASPRDSNPRFDQPDSSLFAKSEFGILFGSPALFNLEAGYWPHPVYGVRVSGFYWGQGFAGVQGNLCRTLSR